MQPKLHANISDYKKQGLDDKILELLVKGDNPRSIDDADTLNTYFSNLTFFSKLMDSFGQEHKDLVISSIWRTIRFQKFKCNEVIFKEGEVSNGKMFVVISGEVSVAIKKKINVFEEENKKQQLKEEQEKRLKSEDSQKSIDFNSASNKELNSNIGSNIEDNELNEEGNENEENFNQNNAVSPAASLLRKLGRKDTVNKIKSINSPSNKVSTPMNRQKIKRDQSLFYFDLSSLGDVVAKLGNGFSFGEKAIMEEGGIRMASIFASQETESLVLLGEIKNSQYCCSQIKICFSQKLIKNSLANDI